MNEATAIRHLSMLRDTFRRTLICGGGENPAVEALKFAIDALNHPTVSVGRFDLFVLNEGRVWIKINQGEQEGEGMEVEEPALESVLQQFYDREF